MSTFLPDSWNPEKKRDLLDLAAGILLGFGFLKFGTPATLAEMVPPPADLIEILFFSWPLQWGYFLCAVLSVTLLIAGRSAWKSKDFFHWALLPCILWFGWNLIAAFSTIDPALTEKVLTHFLVLVLLYYAGWVSKRAGFRLGYLIAGLALGYLMAIWNGLTQQFGGLEATRQFIYSQEGWETKYPPEYLYRIERNRIFSTLTYPNSFACLIILVAPSVAALIFRGGNEMRGKWLGWIACGLFMLVSMACLWWTGSKTAFLVALVQFFLAFVILAPIARLWRFGIAGVIVVGCLAGFAVQYSDYFKEGARSLTVGRFGYWRAAAITFQENPVTGSGPGTFFRAFQKLKRPEDEMARLAHNDYLQQASDAGLPAAVFYAGIIFLALVRGAQTLRSALLQSSPDLLLYFGVWVGFFGWCLQSFMEWTLYIPAIACVALFMAGMLAAGDRQGENS